MPLMLDGRCAKLSVRITGTERSHYTACAAIVAIDGQEMMEALCKASVFVSLFLALRVYIVFS